MTKGFSIREAVREDAPVIFGFIRAIAEYEKMSDEVEGSSTAIERVMFDEHQAGALLAEVDGVPVGFALYCFNFSTFKAKHGLYLEDLFVNPEYRGKGYGKALLLALCRIAREKDCGRMEWCCLDWNTPSIEFYRNLGARAMSEWTTYRLDEAQIEALAGGSEGL